MKNQFAADIRQGLTSKNKFLPSKYFYDTKGSEIFIEIMNMPEYYLTNAEHEIFKNQALDLLKAFDIQEDEYFELIELGAGDGSKTIELLKALNGNFKFDYKPIDISSGALNQLKKNIQDELPNLKIDLEQGDFFEKLYELQSNKTKKIVLFLGSTLGNMEDTLARDFLAEISKNLNKKDLLLIGLDQIKEKGIVYPAYNDPNGITSSFNLNLLERINKEFRANFDLKYFEHRPEYSEKTGIAKSFLKSMKNQCVKIEDLDLTITFEKEEQIFMEISRKYNDPILKDLIENSDFRIKHKFQDSKKYFADYILEIK